MRRAAILIGVNKTGGLPVLADAARGATRMRKWALDQGMAEEDVFLFTDENGPVEIAPIQKVVRAIVDRGAVEQLLVYFAGHGVNIRYGEFWLLSEAPINASAAVNVEGSVVLARRCGINHVVFISDACRTAAEGVQAQGVTGSEIFPNDPVSGPERPVDLFFATTLGRPALEIKSATDSSAAFRAVYTDVLLDAIMGKLSNCVESAPGSPSFVVRPRSLKLCLGAELPSRFAAAGLSSSVSQEPDARITSDGTAWVAGFNKTPEKQESAPTFRSSAFVASRSVSRSTSARRHLDTALSAGVLSLRSGGISVSRGVDRAVEGANEARHTTAAVTLRANCGFRLRRGRLNEALAAGIPITISDSDRSIATLSVSRAINVLLVLADGSSVVLPALPGFEAVLSFDRGELADVAYEPLPASARYGALSEDASNLQELRDTIALAAREGVFRLEGVTGLDFAERLQDFLDIDPALGMYAAYAFHNLNQRHHLRHLRESQHRNLGMSFFDLEMLAGDSRNRPLEATCFPPFPLLAQGWSLLSAFEIILDENIRVVATSTSGDPILLQSYLVDSLWTQFKCPATDHLRKLMLRGQL